MDTALRGQTRVCGAVLPIIAVENQSTDTRAISAGIPFRTGISIITRLSGCAVDASFQGVTSIRRAKVPVIAIEGRAAFAIPGFAEISYSTSASVRASSVMVSIRAARFRVTSIIGASIAVITDQTRSSLASPLSTPIVPGAGIAIIAREGMVRKDASHLLITEVIGAGIAIIADQRLPKACPVFTCLLVCALQSIFTGNSGHGGGDTTCFGVTGIRCTGVPIIARIEEVIHAVSPFVAIVHGTGVAIGTFNTVSTLAFPFEAIIPQQTGLTVVTGPRFGLIGTPQSRGTGILGAGFTIITGSRGPTRAITRGTILTDGAFVPIVTPTIVGSIQTGARFVTSIDGAWISIITKPLINGPVTIIILPIASLQAGFANIGVQWLTVIIIHRVIPVVVFIAGISDPIEVAVDLVGIKNLGTIVFGIAHTILIAILVHFSITIVVDPIANLFFRGITGTRGEVSIFTKPITCTGPGTIDHHAGGSLPLCGFIAGTHALFSHSALLHPPAFHGLHLFTCVSCGTFVRGITVLTTKASHLWAIRDASPFSRIDTALCTRIAGMAESRL